MVNYCIYRWEVSVLALPRLLFADFNNHTLPGMHDGPQQATEAAAALLALRESGVCRVLLTPTYRPFYESVRRFRLRRAQAFRLLRDALPRQTRDMQICLAAQVALEPDCCAAPALGRLAIPNSDYLMVELPIPAFADWVDFELHLLLHRQHLRPVFAHFERAVLLYPEAIVSRLLTVPGAAYQFGLASVGRPEILPVLRQLIRQEKPVLLGTGARLPAQTFPQFDAQLSALQAALGSSAYASLLRRSFGFACFSSSPCS